MKLRKTTSLYSRIWDEHIPKHLHRCISNVKKCTSFRFWNALCNHSVMGEEDMTTRSRVKLKISADIREDNRLHSGLKPYVHLLYGHVKTQMNMKMKN